MTLLALLLSAALCAAYLRLALHLQLLDEPGHRSSHQRPTPHGGGLPLMLAFTLSLGPALFFGGGWESGYPLLLVLALGLCLCLVGVVDDLVGLAVAPRFALYGLACLLALLLVLGSPLAWSAIEWALFPLAFVALLWLLNLYNFMDGIDGLAATQCILASCTVAFLVGLRGGDPAYVLTCLLLAAAHAGFLIFNWAPARLFMGDAGSIPSGFLLGVLALLGMEQGELPLACWLILLACFITDATVTLAWRGCTGQRIFEAHRLHAYQRLSREWGSHSRVVIGLIVVHVFWLAPLSALASFSPQYGPFLVILAYIPLLFGMAKAMRLG